MMAPRHIAPCAALAICLWATTAGAAARSEEDMLRVGAFSTLSPSAALPPGWEMLTFPKVSRHTHYRLVRDGDTTVIEARSRNAAAGLIRRLDIDPRRYPVLRWRWKITRLLPGSDLRRRDGDDYPARVYITFAYAPEHLSWGRRLRYRAARLLYGDVPAAAINYVWARKAERGLIVDNAYTDFTKMIVVESGPSRVGRWITEERNVYEDFRRAFGYEAPRITGVALMTDSDDSGGEGLSYYGDMEFLPAPQAAGPAIAAPRRIR